MDDPAQMGEGATPLAESRRIGPALGSGFHALKASDGWAVAVSDADVYAAQRRLAREEAIFAEPAGAAALAGLLADVSAGRISQGDVVARGAG